MSEKQKYSERLQAWKDGDSFQIIAVTSLGDPIDCSADEAKAFAEKILNLVKEAEEG